MFTSFLQRFLISWSYIYFEFYLCQISECILEEGTVCVISSDPSMHREECLIYNETLKIFLCSSITACMISCKFRCALHWVQTGLYAAVDIRAFSCMEVPLEITLTVPLSSNSIFRLTCSKVSRLILRRYINEVKLNI